MTALAKNSWLNNTFIYFRDYCTIYITKKSTQIVYTTQNVYCAIEISIIIKLVFQGTISVRFGRPFRDVDRVTQFNNPFRLDFTVNAHGW